MSNLRTTAEVVAIVCADIHLSMKPPVARSREPDWFAAMARPLLELSLLASQFDVPVICAGDVFDKWNVSPELICFAFDYLPEQFYCIPGQHDLPYHSLADLHRSGLGVLVRSRRVTLVSTDTILHSCFALTGFAWNVPIAAPTFRDQLNVAMVHRYCWKRGLGYKDAAQENYAGNLSKELEGYNVAIFGDNHSPFAFSGNGCLVYNCGGFMRRKSDDNFQPSCGILRLDGSIERHYFDLSEEVFDQGTSAEVTIDDNTDEGIQEFVKSLTQLDCDPLDFATQLQLAAEHETDPQVQEALRQLIHANH